MAGDLDLMTFKGPFQLKPLYDSMILKGRLVTDVFFLSQSYGALTKSSKENKQKETTNLII